MPALPVLTPLTVYQIEVSLLSLATLVNAIVDWFAFRRPAPPPWTPKTDRLAVAFGSRSGPRTKCGVIGACVRSLLRKRLPRHA